MGQKNNKKKNRKNNNNSNNNQNYWTELAKKVYDPGMLRMLGLSYKEMGQTLKEWKQMGIITDIDDEGISYDSSKLPFSGKLF